MAHEESNEITLRVTGMDCTDCARSIERGVGKLEGVQSSTLNFGAATLHVRGTASQEAVVARVRELGYDARPRVAEVMPQGQQGGVLGFIHFLLQRQDTTLALVGALLILPGLLFDELRMWPAAPAGMIAITSLLALCLAGFPVARSAWRSVRVNHEININVLMTIAAIGAVLIGAYTEAGLVMVLFAIGEALEGYTMERARNSIHSLMQVAPNEATVLRACVDCREHLGQGGYTGGACPFCGVEEQRVPVDTLRVGETVVVKPGERIPVDGQLTEGASSVNQSPITGESLPVPKAVGDAVFAGSINGEGALQVRVLVLAADSTISRIIGMVEQAQEKRAPAQRFVDQFARYYTPAVVAAAIVVAAVPPLLFGAPFLNPAPGVQGWLYRALELLVVACPCALVISTPVSLIAGISNAARNGVLIKGGAYLELLSKVKVVAFDKTGTLTEGKPDVTGVWSVDCQTCDHGAAACASCDDMLALATAVERRSEHPLARAVVDMAARNGVDGKYPVAEGVTALAGKGVAGEVSGHRVTIGSHTYFDAWLPHDASLCRQVDAASARGDTPLLVSVDDEYRGYIAVADRVRQASRSTLAALRRMGIKVLVMLTGDNPAAANTIAAQVGVTDVRANLLPEHKVDAVRALREAYGSVAMVGDGVNDAPALASASVGIAMGAGGTAQAMETADVVLMADDLNKLPFAFGLSRAVMRTVRTNIALSILIKFVFLVLVLLGTGSMWMAVLADMGTSLLVTLNGMRMLAYRQD
jgi:Cd2+/Zn2+-exporting ATPase